MTLRDWFAGQALSAMNCLTLEQSGTRNPDVFFEAAAANAYRYADAMLEARKAKP
jgi:hypothetical protein